MNENEPTSGFSCPVPLSDYPQITLGHGGGGKLSSDLIEHLFLPAFQNPHLENLGDSAVLPVGERRIAFSTDSFVVRPLFFPGGCIGDLAVNGTVNDLAMSGAQPEWLSLGLIIEEGFEINQLNGICEAVSQAAKKAGVSIVTGDTKVVEKGYGDGCYINTSGIGLVPEGVQIGPKFAKPGDVILVSGTIADHGMAIMSVREGLEFETEIQSDSAPLNHLVQAMLDVTKEIHVLRDPTRGGVASTLNEIAEASKVGIVIEDGAIPVKPSVQSACEFLGLDPLFVANEGKLIAIVDPKNADELLEAMKKHPDGKDAVIIGQVTDQHPGRVVMKTVLGTSRVITTQIGEQLPRIC